MGIWKAIFSSKLDQVTATPPTLSACDADTTQDDRRIDVAQQVITSENCSLSAIKAILDAAFFDTVVEDNKIIIKDLFNIVLIIPEAKIILNFLFYLQRTEKYLSLTRLVL
jgi:hypothetical protein